MENYQEDAIRAQIEADIAKNEAHMAAQAAKAVAIDEAKGMAGNIKDTFNVLKDQVADKYTTLKDKATDFAAQTLDKSSDVLDNLSDKAYVASQNLKK